VIAGGKGRAIAGEQEGVIACHVLGWMSALLSVKLSAIFLDGADGHALGLPRKSLFLHRGFVVLLILEMMENQMVNASIVLLHAMRQAPGFCQCFEASAIRQLSALAPGAVRHPPRYHPWGEMFHAQSQVDIAAQQNAWLPALLNGREASCHTRMPSATCGCESSCL
jgi:hypothetical protein